MSDQQITCSECGDIFIFRDAEQQFYTERGLASPPKRCKTCRQARRAEREGVAQAAADKAVRAGMRRAGASVAAVIAGPAPAVGSEARLARSRWCAG